MRAGSVAMTILAACVAANAQPPPPQPVKNLDLQRYAGSWYEIAAVPNRFQKDCARETTASYTVLPDQRLGVDNRCAEADGEVDEARGRAKAGDRPGTLKVSFIHFFDWWFWLFSGDYWVLALDTDYQWALVGHPTRRYGWVLARHSSLTSDQREAILVALRAQGYDPCKLITTPQRGGETERGSFCQIASTPAAPVPVAAAEGASDPTGD